MRFPFTKRRAETRASYTDSVTELLLRQAIGADAEAGQTAAAEFAIGLVSRCFAVADLDPAIPAVTPSYLADVGRRLMLRGNAVAAIRVAARGLTLLPAAGFDVMGGPDPVSWYYAVHLPGPTRLENHTLAAASVVHILANADAAQPWVGISPLAHAGLSSKLVARLEQRIGEESNSRVGYLLPHPELSDPQITTLKNDLETMRGNIGLVKKETTNYDARGQAGGQADWAPRRFGPHLPEGNIRARRDAAMDLVAALGIPPSLFVGDNSGTSLQESYRIFSVSTLEPLGRLAAHELAVKLDVPGLTIRFDRVAASDVVRRATAYEKLRTAGVEDDRARQLANVR